MSDYQRHLHARSQTVDMSRLGMVSVNKPKWISPQRMKAYVQYAIAQALLDNIGQAEDGLCVRNIYPHHDLLDGNGDQLETDEWVQPASGYNAETRLHPQPGQHRLGYATNDTTIDLYSTNMRCNNHRKVYLLYGFKNMKYFSQPVREGEVISTQAEIGGPAEVFLTSLSIMRGRVKLIDIPDLSQINEIGYIFLQTPILYKRNDDMVIRGTTKHNAQGNTDNLKLQCIIAEAIGANITG